MLDCETVHSFDNLEVPQSRSDTFSLLRGWSEQSRLTFREVIRTECCFHSPHYKPLQDNLCESNPVARF